MRLRLLLVLILAASSARADSLTDLRAALGRLAATTPVRGSLEVTSSSNSSESGTPRDGKVTVAFEMAEGGLHLIYPRAVMLQTSVESKFRDPDRPTPVTNALREIRPREVFDLIDAGGALIAALESGQLVAVKAAAWNGRPAHLLLIRLEPKMSKDMAKHVKKLDVTMSVWTGEDGLPLAAEQSTNVKASFMLMSFSSDQKENWTFARSGDRLVAIRHENSNKSDGMGQHGVTRTTEVLRLE